VNHSFIGEQNSKTGGHCWQKKLVDKFATRPSELFGTI
jgi:hypothetical protein